MEKTEQPRRRRGGHTVHKDKEQGSAAKLSSVGPATHGSAQSGSGNGRPRLRSRRSGHRQPARQPNNYAFIDSQNLNLGVQKVGWKMDWHKFRQWLTDQHGVTKAFMFIGYMPDNESLYEQMYEHGFLVALKPTLEIKNVHSVAGSTQQKTLAAKTSLPDESISARKDGAATPDKPAIKGNIDADLVLYAMKELPNYDKAVIVTGDGDFYGLVEYLITQGKLHKVLAPNRRYSTLLQQFDEYIEGLDQHRSELAYHDKRRKKS